MRFEQYVQEKKLASKTIQTYCYNVGLFKEWLEAERIQEIDYPNLLKFIRSRRSLGESRNLIASRLTAVRWWLRWQKSEGTRATNPAEGLHLKGQKRRLPHDLLEAEELEQIYNEAPTTTIIEQRNKTILGLLVHQGITTGELARLETFALRFRTREYSNSAHQTKRRENARLKAVPSAGTLPLPVGKPPEIVGGKRKRKPKNYSSLLEGSASLGNTLQTLSNQLKTKHSYFTGFPQIRASVIANWLKVHPLRQVQYWAGHRYVSSTERYLLGGLESLKQSVEQFHPLR